MFRYLFLAMALSASVLLSAQEVKRVQLPVTSATVFTHNAQIIRTGKVALPAGKSRIWVGGITTSLADGTLQATVTGQPVILSIARKDIVPGEESTPDIQEQLRWAEDLKDSLEINKIKLEVLGNEKELLLLNRQLGGTQGVKAAELKQLADFIVSRLTEISGKIYECQKEKIRLEKRALQIDRKLKSLRARQQRTAAGVEILIESPAALTTTLTVSYIVDDAGWYPLYDLRLPEERGEAKLSSRAKVWQNTGVDWKNVSLILSSGNPQTVGELPVIYPYYLKNEPRQVMIRNVVNAALPQGVDGFASSGYEENPVEEESGMMDRGTGMQSLADQSQNMNNVDYMIRIPYSIPSGNEGSEVQIAGLTIPVVYEYRVTPRLSREAQLVAGIADYSSYNLMDGEISLYLGNAYRGTQRINRYAVSAVNDVLNLSMGTDKNIAVKRTPKQNFRKVSGGVVKEQRLWETIIRNNKTIAVKIKVEDQYPLSLDDKIKVEDLTYTSENVTVDPDTGKLTWLITLQPKETVSVNLGYTVRYPKGWEVNVR